MKQLPKTAEIIARLNKAAGPGVSTDNLVVYEAVALNTRPLRKRNQLYKDAIVSRGMLLEMAASLERESVPIQIMHDGNVLPLGRAFHAKVVDDEQVGGSELRALFSVDKTNQDVIDKIEAGSVDQVSVSVLSKTLKCSGCGFNFFGSNVSLDRVFSGTCDKGHVLGKDGVHANLDGLDQWFELSLVGQGGAQNARIVDRSQSRFTADNPLRLAASGRDLDDFILTASAETPDDKMDLTALTAALQTQTSTAALATAEVTRLTAANAAHETEIARLTGLVAAAGEAATTIAARDNTITAQAADLAASDTALRDVLTKVLVASGNVNPTLPADRAGVITAITEAGPKLAAALALAGKSAGAEDDATKTPINLGLGAFRAAPRR